MAPIAPPPTHVPYLAGFNHPNSGTQGNARSVATEIIYPFITVSSENWLDRLVKAQAHQPRLVRRVIPRGVSPPKTVLKATVPKMAEPVPLPPPPGGGPVTRPEGAQTLGGTPGSR